jgi:hypothetical protein
MWVCMFILDFRTLKLAGNSDKKLVFVVSECRRIEWTRIIATLENHNRIRIQVCRRGLARNDFADGYRGVIIRSSLLLKNADS